MSMPRRAVLLGGAGILTTSRSLRTANARRLIEVDAAAELAIALSTAEPGDYIRLADGVYTSGGPLVLRAHATPDAPVAVIAATPGRAVLLDPVILAGTYARLEGLDLNASSEIDGDGNRITRCRFIDNPVMALLIRGGRDVRVDRCEFARCRGRGISVKPSRGMAGLRIDRNHFHDFVGAKGENVHEPLQLGQGLNRAAIALGALVERNLFERVSIDSECISVKSSANTIRYNTLLDSQSRITNRVGKHNLYHANWSERSHGILLRDEGHEVVNNRLIESERHGLMVCAGNVGTRFKAMRLKSGKVGQPCAKNVRLIGNAADRTMIGFAFNNHTVPAEGTRLESHFGPIEYGIETGTVVLEESFTPALPTAFRLQLEDVGPWVGGDD